MRYQVGDTLKVTDKTVGEFVLLDSNPPDYLYDDKNKDKVRIGNILLTEKNYRLTNNKNYAFHTVRRRRRYDK